LPKMPSRLRYQQDFEPTSTGTVRPSFSAIPPPQKKQKMSLTQTYYIASSARAKLGKEACRPDHNLRLLVGHANLLDSLMLDLQDAEREQEAWFNQTVQKAQKAEEPRHIKWADTIVEEEDEEEEEDAEESDADSDYDEEDFQMIMAGRNGIRQAPVSITSEDMDEDEDEEEDFYDEEEDVPELALTRTQSHSASPPELIDDSDSEDDSPPASPPQPNFDLELFDKKHTALIEDGFFIPQRAAPMVAAY
jgi:hypothetical protein